MTATQDTVKIAPIPLADRGTTGLLQYVAAGPDRLFSARLARALKVISSRTNSRVARAIFSEVANDERADRNGWTKPIKSPLARVEAYLSGDPTAYHHATLG